MSEYNESEGDSTPDSYLTHWEKKCLEEWEKESLLEERSQTDGEKSSQKLWTSFQTLASSISQLFKEGSQPTVISLWIPFQSAASNATTLYKEGTEAIKKNHELGQQVGTYKKTKEIITWAKKRRRHIQREELIAFLCGKPLRHHHHHRVISSNRSSHSSSRFLPSTPAEGGDLQLFRDALAVQNQSGSRRSPSRTLCEDFLLVDGSTRKRVPFDRLESPSCKRQKICGMETDDP